MDSVPLWETLVLEKPIYGVVLIALIGGVAWWVLSMRGRSKAALSAVVGAVAAALGVYAIGTAIETPREAASARSVEFINAIVAEDIGTVESMLAPNAIMLAGGQGPEKLPRSALVSAVGNLDGEIRSNAISVQGASVASNGDVRVRFRCSSNVQTAGSMTVRSVWDADWRKGASGQWWLTRLDCLWISGVPEDAWIGWALRFAGRG
jgi:hypothetical protein